MQKEFSGLPFEWIDVSLPTEAELHELAAKYKLPAPAVLDCLQSDHLPKFEAFDNYTFVIFRMFDMDGRDFPSNFQQLTRKLAIFFNDGFLLTIHRSNTDIIENVANKYCGDPIVKSPFDIVCKINKNVLETFQIPLKDIDRQVDVYEQSIFLKKRIPDLLKTLYQIKRKAYLIKRLNLINKSVIEALPVNHKKSPYYTDMHDYFIGLDTLTEEIYDSINSILHLYLAISSQKTNEVMRILTAFSAFFLPLTFIVGVYGMNFSYMPELNMYWAYPAVLFFMAIITFGIYIWFRRRGWLQ
jgi:magnesium transporter